MGDTSRFFNQHHKSQKLTNGTDSINGTKVTEGVNGHTNGYTNGHTNGHTNGNTNGYTNGHTNGTNGA